MGELRKRVAKGTAWTTGLHGLSMIVELSIMALLARLLSPSDFGIVAAAMIFMGLVNIFSEVGVAPTIVQLPGLVDDDLRAGLTISMLFSIACVAVTYVSAPWVAGLFHMPHLTEVLRVIGTVFVMRGASVVSEARLTRELRIQEARIVQLAARVFGYGLFSAVFALKGFGYWSLVYGTLIEEALRAVGTYAVARIPLRPTFGREQWRRVIGNSAGFTAVNLINFAALNGDTTIVAMAADASSVGLYSRAFKLMSFPTTLYTKVADQVVFPAMAMLQSDLPRLRRAYLEATEVGALIGLPLSVMIALLGPDLILFLYGPRWTAAIPIFSALAPGVFARFSTRTSGSLLRALASVRALFIAQLIYAVSTVVGCWLTIDHGVVVMAGAVSGALMLFFVVLTTFACRALAISLREFVAVHVPGVMLAVILAIIGGLLAHYLHMLGVTGFFSLALTGAACGIALLALAVINPLWLFGRAGSNLLTQIKAKATRRRQGGRSAPHVG